MEGSAVVNSSSDAQLGFRIVLNWERDWTTFRPLPFNHSRNRNLVLWKSSFEIELNPNSCFHLIICTRHVRVPDVVKFWSIHFNFPESLSTVNIDSDQSTGLINQWIGIDIQIDVGTISHHSWDHDSFVDVYPGPFLITSGTIWDHKLWPFFS